MVSHAHDLSQLGQLLATAALFSGVGSIFYSDDQKISNILMIVCGISFSSVFLIILYLRYFAK